MKKCSIFFSVLLVAIYCLAFLQCKKRSNILPYRQDSTIATVDTLSVINSDSSNITLYDKDTATVEKYIIGKWKLRYRYGGYTGGGKFDVDSSNIFYEFSSNKHIKITSQGNITADTSYTWATYKAGSSDYTHNLLQFNAVIVPSHFEVVQIKIDTLILAQPFLGNPDYMTNFLTNVK
jgi:hypothetical protein